MARPTLTEILERVIQEENPRVVTEMGVSLNVTEAESLCRQLRQEGYEIQPFDFPRTRGVWKSVNENGISYTQIATKQLISALADDLDVDYTTIEGFKAILPYLNVYTFQNSAINTHGTTLGGMLTGQPYRNSPSAPVLELVANDPEFSEIKENNLQDYDFMGICHSWKDKEGNPTDKARYTMKLLMQKVALDRNIKYNSLGGIIELSSILTQSFVAEYPINIWETRVHGMFVSAYKGNICTAISDVINHYSNFSGVRKRALQYLKSVNGTLKFRGASS
jgi:hypothetical protein